MKYYLTSLLFSMCIIAAITLQATEEETSSEGALVHTVYFWFHDAVTEEQHADFYSELKKLKEIEQIIHGWVGVPAETEARGVIDSSYDYSITFVFESVAAEHEYQVHPIHTEFVETNAHLWEKVVVYDAVTP